MQPHQWRWGRGEGVHMGEIREPHWKSKCKAVQPNPHIFSVIYSSRTPFSSKKTLTKNTAFVHTCLNTHSYWFSFLVFTGALVTFSSQFTHIMCFFSLWLPWNKASKGTGRKTLPLLMYFCPKYWGILFPWNISHYLHVWSCVHTTAY